MCLYPKLIQNRKYVKNKKNGGIIPPVLDNRVLFVPVGCQKCIECRKQNARNWNVRLSEEVKRNNHGKFVTLTFSNESIAEIAQDIKGLSGYDLDNQIATVAVRRFLERYRKKYKVSIRHWLITELGHNGTENIHLHGILWTKTSLNEIEKIWNYGWIWKGKGDEKKNYVNGQTVNYITKYVTKIDEKHKEYKPKILTSPGIGRGYNDTLNAKNNAYKPNNTNETYKTDKGHKMALPIYYRNQIYTEEEREKLWLEKLDKQERYICGEKVDISKGDAEYYALLEYYRQRNKELGYGDDQINWERKLYEQQRRNILIKERIDKADKKKKKE